MRTFVMLALVLSLFAFPAIFQTTAAESPAKARGNNVVASIFVGQDTNQIVYNPSNNEVYVSYGGGYGEGEPNISIIAASTNKVIKIIPNIETGEFLYDPLNHDIYASSGTNVLVIDSASNSISKSIKLPASYVGALVYDSLNHNLYVSSFNYIYAINTLTNTVVGKIQVQFWPFNSMVFDAARNCIYATEPSTNGSTYLSSIQVISLASRKVIASIGCSFCQPGSIVYDSATHGIYFSEVAYESVGVINASANTITHVVRFSGGAFTLLFDNSKQIIFLGGDTHLLELNPTSPATIEKSFTLKGAPRTFTLDTKSSCLYITNKLTPYVTVLSV